MFRNSKQAVGHEEKQSFPKGIQANRIIRATKSQKHTKRKSTSSMRTLRKNIPQRRLLSSASEKDKSKTEKTSRNPAATNKATTKTWKRLQTHQNQTHRKQQTNDMHLFYTSRLGNGSRLSNQTNRQGHLGILQAHHDKRIQRNQDHNNKKAFHS